MAVEISRRSRLNFGELIQDGLYEYWEMLELGDIPVQTDDFQYIVQSFDRIDLLADRFYGSSDHWWIIAVANNIDEIPTGFNVGQTLRIPSPRYVSQELFKGLK